MARAWTVGARSVAAKYDNRAAIGGKNRRDRVGWLIDLVTFASRGKASVGEGSGLIFLRSWEILLLTSLGFHRVCAVLHLVSALVVYESLSS